jgi:hypothetical protein
VTTHHLCILSLVLAAPVLAQGERTTATVTPQGVFYQRTAGQASGAGAFTDVVGNLRWTSPGGTSITERVSVGNLGTMAWLGRSTNNQRYTLLATTENNPPTFIYELPKPSGSLVQVKAADKAPYAVTATKTAGVNTIDFWSCFSTTPLWSKTANTDVLIDISENGQFVAIGFSPTTGSAQVDVYLSFAPATPIATLVATTQGLRQMDLSDDGSTLLIATHNHDHIFDVATQTEIFQDGSTVSHDAHAISRNGNAFGRGGFNPVRAWVKNGGVYNNVLTYSDSSLGFAVYTAAGISADGTTFAAAAYDANNNALLRIRCWALTPTSSTLLWSYTSNGSGSLQTTPQAVSLSDDGRYIAVGTWGDQNNTSPEVMVFARNGTGAPIATIDTPGSCFDLDLSGDGQFLVVGTKAVHANIFGNGGEGYSYDLGGQSFWLSGTPSLGRSITLSTQGNPSDPILLGFATGFGTPLTIPGISGQLLLDTNHILTTLFAGIVPASGVQVFPLTVPNSAVLIGMQLAVQGFNGGSVAFTNALLMPITQ